MRKLFLRQQGLVSPALWGERGTVRSVCQCKRRFLLRLEALSAFAPALVAGERTTPEGNIPVIYLINIKDPTIFFAAQSFPIHNKDVIYVSNAPLADFQKFVNVASSLIYPIIAVQNTVRN